MSKNYDNPEAEPRFMSDLELLIETACSIHLLEFCNLSGTPESTIEVMRERLEQQEVECARRGLVEYPAKIRKHLAGGGNTADFDYPRPQIKTVGGVESVKIGVSQ